MSETKQSVRRDSAARQIQEKEKIDWSGKRVILPRGTTLPASGLPAEVFVKTNAAAEDQMFVWDDNLDRWVTIGQ